MKCRKLRVIRGTFSAVKNRIRFDKSLSRIAFVELFPNGLSTIRGEYFHTFVAIFESFNWKSSMENFFDIFRSDAAMIKEFAIFVLKASRSIIHRQIFSIKYNRCQFLIFFSRYRGAKISSRLKIKKSQSRHPKRKSLYALVINYSD